ncbi:chromosome condensation complex Condensin, subunit G [Kalmusia sp. IMI 367209]|nr:chromosome condensation complex Condensin, subunit G [Kalmusia sp. IMI 367209]
MARALLRAALIRIQSSHKQTTHPADTPATTKPYTNVMPGRTSTRSARSSTAAPRKSAKGRGSTSNVEIPDEGPDIPLRAQIAQIFDDAQNTTATQRKLQTMLRKIQERCCFEPPTTKRKKGHEEEVFDEEQFNDEVTRCVLRILNVKKGVAEADRVIRFVGLFLKHAGERDRAILYPDGEVATGEQPETATSKLISQIISSLISLLFPPDGKPASNKTVRYRATQTLTVVIGNLETIDDDLFALVRVSFKKLSRDKEAAVRTQAVMGLSRLMPTEDEEEDDDDDNEDEANGIMQKLLDLMQNDPSAEVRRTILHNLEQTPQTLRYMFERARDNDPLVRRIVYRRILPHLVDFRYMRLVEREKLLRWGLKDRDEIVSTAAARLFCERWLENCASSYDTRPEEERKPGVPAPPCLDAVTELLERIDIVNSGAEGGIAHEAMQKFWEIRTDYRELVTFDHDYWKELDPSRAFLARSLSDYLNNLDDKQIKLRQDLEDKIPEVSSFAFLTEKYLNLLIEAVKDYADLGGLPEDDDELKKKQEAADDQDFIVQQLLHIALTLDYSPPLGRTQMFNLTREALTRAELPEECTKLAIQVLRICSDSDSDFCRVILEIIAEVRDTLMPDDDTEKGANADEEDSFHSAQSDIESISGDSDLAVRSKRQKTLEHVDPEEAERKREVEVNVYAKCLHIAQCTLQNVNCNLQSDSSLVTILNTLIIPAVRGQEAMIRERGVLCLGLAAFLSKDLALNNLDLFLHCFAKGHDALKEIVIEVLVDIISVFPSLLAPLPPDAEETATEDTEPTPNPMVKSLTKMMLNGFKSDNQHISYKACIGAAKLLLGGYLPSPAAAEILKGLTRAYFDPERASYASVKQALSYSIPTFCHVKLENALLMAQVSVSVFSKLLQIQEVVDEEEYEMVGWPVITAHFADWTDGRKVVGQTQVSLDGKTSFTQESEEPHIYLATEILERALAHSCSRDERKPLITLLIKLHIASSGPAPDEEALGTLHNLVTEAVEGKIGLDATQRNALAKLEINLAKRIGDVETVTQAPENSGDERMTPDVTDIPETTPAEEEEEEEEEEEDTMMAGLQGESTRMPLETDDDEDEDEAGDAKPVTESDIVESLLASEMEMD